MCTVTYIPVKDKVFITSNRDEKYTRREALPPAFYQHEEQWMIYPRDVQAGGTWIAVRENGDAAVLLNGAFMPHLSAPAYRKSRGLVLLDTLKSEKPSYAFSKMNLDQVEPFTLVLFENRSLYEFRWDGHEKYCRQLPSARPHIWSSATLYDRLTIRKREHWFAAFLNRHPAPTQQDILHFHRFSGDGDKRNDLLMSRDNIYATISITGMLLTAERASMKYLDISKDSLTEKKMELLTPAETL